MAPLTRAEELADFVCSMAALFLAAEEGKNPADSMTNLFSIEDALTKSGRARASANDAGHFVWTAKANSLYNLDKEASRIKAKVLFLPAKTDLLFPPEYSRKAAEKHERDVQYFKRH